MYSAPTTCRGLFGDAAGAGLAAGRREGSEVAVGTRAGEARGAGGAEMVPTDSRTGRPWLVWEEGALVRSVAR